MERKDIGSVGRRNQVEHPVDLGRARQEDENVARCFVQRVANDPGHERGVEASEAMRACRWWAIASLNVELSA
jgi:hypothetical protein